MQLAVWESPLALLLAVTSHRQLISSLCPGPASVLRPSAPRQITVITSAQVCQRFLRYDTLRYDIIQYDTLGASVSVALVKFFKFIANNRIRFIRFIRFIHIIRFIRCAAPRHLNLIYVCFVFLFFFV